VIVEYEQDATVDRAEDEATVSRHDGYRLAASARAEKCTAVASRREVPARSVARTDRVGTEVHAVWVNGSFRTTFTPAIVPVKVRLSSVTAVVLTLPAAFS